MNDKRSIIRYLMIALLLAVAIVAPLIFNTNYFVSVFNQTMINIIVVLGLNFITGLTGQMNLGSAGIIALGAYTSAIMSVKLGVSPWIGMLAAIIMGLIIGQGLGYPSLRVKGVYLSLTTIAFGEIVRLLLNNLQDLTGGTNGIRSIPVYNLFGLQLDTQTKFYYFVFALAILFILFSRRIVNSKWGRVFKALRDNPEAVESLGVNIATIKIMAFTLAAVFGCIAGALYAHLMGYINPSTYTVDISIKYVIMLMVGGIGLISGNVIGAVIVTLLPEALRFLGDYYQIVFYALALIMAIFSPGGWFAWLTSAIKKRQLKIANFVAKDGVKHGNNS